MTGGVFVVLEDEAEGKFEILAKAASRWAGHSLLDLFARSLGFQRFLPGPFVSSCPSAEPDTIRVSFRVKLPVRNPFAAMVETFGEVSFLPPPLVVLATGRLLVVSSLHEPAPSVV